MTVDPLDPTSPDAGRTPQAAAALAAAEACGTVLPASEPLTPGDPQPGNEHVVAVFAAAATAELTGGVHGRLTVLVGEELVAAIASSPLQGLDLAAAVQPALDAAAASLSAIAQPAHAVELALVVDDLAGPFTAVPLLGSGIAAALLVPDTTLAQAVATPAGAHDGPGVADPGPFGDAARAPVAAGTPQGNVRSIADGRRGIEMLHGVEMEVTVELGRTRMAVRDLLALAPGTVLALDRAAGSPADLLVNGRLIARGEVVVIDEDFGLRVTEILDQSAVG